MDTKSTGRLLIQAGTLGFGVAAVQSFTMYAGLDRGTVPAVSLLLLLLGMCFAFPSLLEESEGQVSSMRVTVMAVVMVFVVLHVKAGWNEATSQLTIDEKWVYILGLAFGAKAAQRAVENNQTDTPATDPAAPQPDGQQPAPQSTQQPAAQPAVANPMDFRPATIFTAAGGLEPSLDPNKADG